MQVTGAALNEKHAVQRYTAFGCCGSINPTRLRLLSPFFSPQLKPLPLSAAHCAQVRALLLLPLAMDEHLETSWCTRCDRLIEPERITVQLDELNRPINMLNAPVSVGSPAVTRTRTLAPGLVRGTGRLQPNGALVTADTKARNRDQLPPVPPPSPVTQRTSRASPPAPRRTRTIISQKQTPLYCSAKCRKRDADNLRLQTLARRESDSTASTSSAHSLFDTPDLTTNSASSLESCDVPTRQLVRSTCFHFTMN